MSKRKDNKENLGLKNFCLTFIRWGTYLILFTPLILARASFFPFVTPKTIYFRVLTDIIFGFYFILAVFFPDYRPKINVLSIAVFLFAGVFILTSITGINFTRSFWSTYERMTGVLTILHLTAFFVVITSVFKERKDWDKILGLSMLVGVLLCCYVLAANEASTRGGGTVGNTSFMAAYLLFDIFFAIMFLLEKRSTAWRLYSAVSLLFYMPVLISANARGATVCLFGGLVLLLLAYLVFSEKKPLKTAGVSLVLILIIGAVALAVIRPPFVQNEISYLLNQMSPRFVVWQKAWEGFLERPILGWGPENFNVVFLQHFNPCMFIPNKCGGEVWFDRAHNIVFDTLVTMGIVGMISYLFIFGAAVMGIFRKYVKEKEDFFPYWVAMILLIVYFFQNLLVFDMISSYMIFFLALGFAYFLMAREGETVPAVTEEKESKFSTIVRKKTVKYPVFLLAAGLMGFVLFFMNIQPYNSAINVVRIITAKGGIEEQTEFFKKALNSWMEKYEVREQFAQRLYNVSPPAPGEETEKVKAIFNLAETEMEKSIRENSLDFRPRLFLGRLYAADYRTTFDSLKLDVAEKTLEKAIEISPTNQQGYWYMTEVKLAKNEQDEVFSLFQKAIDLEPELGLSYWYSGLTYKMIGEYSKAIEKINEAEQAAYPYRWRENSSDLNQVIEMYRVIGDHKTLVQLYQDSLKLDSEDANTWANLAESYAKLGQNQQAREAAIKAKELNPDLTENVDKFIQSLQ